MEAVTGENVAGAIIDYVLKNYKRGGMRKTTNSQGATNKIEEARQQAIDQVKNTLPASTDKMSDGDIIETFPEMIARLQKEILG